MILSANPIATSQSQPKVVVQPEAGCLSPCKCLLLHVSSAEYKQDGLGIQSLSRHQLHQVACNTFESSEDYPLKEGLHTKAEAP